MNREKFIEMISIDEKGHRPFYLYTENSAGEATLMALAVDSVETVYLQVCRCLAEGNRKIYVTIDFPALLDMQTDFVAVYFTEDGAAWESVLIPYNARGERLEQVTGGAAHRKLLDQLRHWCNFSINMRKAEAKAVSNN